MNKKDSTKQRRRNRRYDAEFKLNALRLVESGQSVPSVAKSLGIDKSLLYAWQRQANLPSAAEETEMNETEHLRKRVVELEQERDILKKTLAIFSRQIVGWHLANHMRAELVRDAFQKVLNKGRVAPGMIVHSDGGRQYSARMFRNLLQKHNCQQSMTRKDNHYEVV